VADLSTPPAPDNLPPEDSAALPDGMSEEFVGLFTRHQRRLFLYILSQIFNPVEAEEVLQETNLVLLAKHGQFEPGTNFYAWACRIAGYEILKNRERRARDRHQFSDDFLRQVAEDVAEASPELERRRIALGTCLKKLRAKDRELIRKRYRPGQSGKGLAEELGRPANSVYQSLGRIRKTLLECIRRQLAPNPSC